MPASRQASSTVAPGARVDRRGRRRSGERRVSSVLERRSVTSRRCRCASTRTSPSTSTQSMSSLTNAAMSETDTMPTGTPSRRTGSRRIASSRCSRTAWSRSMSGSSGTKSVNMISLDRHRVGVAAVGDHGVRDLPVGDDARPACRRSVTITEPTRSSRIRAATRRRSQSAGIATTRGGHDVADLHACSPSWRRRLGLRPCDRVERTVGLADAALHALLGGR